MAEYIYLHVGGFGAQLGEQCWNVYCNEHDLDFNGASTSGNTSVGIHTHFRETSAGVFKPRAIFLDTDTVEMLKLQQGSNRELFRDQYFRTLEDYDFSGYRGFEGDYVEAKSCENSEFARREVERTDRLAAFIFTNSAQGLKSSITTTRVLTSLTGTYTKKKNAAFTEYGIGDQNSISTYYTGLYQAGAARLTDCSFIFDFDAIGRIFRKTYSIPFPRSIDGLKLIAHTISSLTTANRMARTWSGGFCQYLSNLLVSKKTHYPLLMFGSHNEESRTTWELTRKVFQPKSCLSSIDFRNETVFGNVFIYRGVKQRKSVTNDFQKVRSVPYYRQMIRGAFNQIENYAFPPVIEEYDEFDGMISSLVLASHTTAVRHLFEKLAKKIRNWEDNCVLTKYFGIDKGGEFSGVASNLMSVAQDYKKEILSEEDDEE